MHKGIYASGFLYHPSTQQILLQQSSNKNAWQLLEGMCLKTETADRTFQRIAYTLLNIRLKMHAIFEVYSYTKSEMGKNRAVFYATVEHDNILKGSKKDLYAWFTKKQLIKLPLDEQTKQDLIVGQRVIDAHMRKSMGLHVLE